MFGKKKGSVSFNPAFRDGQRFRAPGGQRYVLYADMLEQKHLLIAGATGSGKSVLVNNLIYSALMEGPDKRQFILIDPKRVELKQWRMVPHVIDHATEPADMVKALQRAVDIVEGRYREMEKKGLKTYEGSHVYVIIDELADLMTTNKREVLPLLQRLGQIARAARVSIIGCTQNPLTTVIPTSLRVNFDSVVGLRTATAQHSRNIMYETGCESLPEVGYGYYIKPRHKELHQLPMIPQEQIDAMIRYWTTSACAA